MPVAIPDMRTTVKSPFGAATDRRGFLKNSALTALAAGVATACKPESKALPATVVQTGMPSGGTMGAHDTVAASDAMDAMHEKGIKAFPAKTTGKGNQRLAPRI